MNLPEPYTKMKAYSAIKKAKGGPGSIFITTLLFVMILPAALFAQAPTLSYAGPQTYYDGQQIKIVPASSGAAPFAYGPATTYATGFNNPNGLATDTAGNVYVVDAGNLALKKIAKDGTVSTLNNTNLNNPRCVAVDLAGNLYVTDAQTVKEFLPNGTFYQRWYNDSHTYFYTPYGITIIGANILVSNFNGNGTTAIKGSGQGNVSYDPANFNQVKGITGGTLGYYFASYGDHALERMELIPPAYPIDTILKGVLPSGIVADYSEHVFVTDDQNNQVLEIPETGGTPTVIGSITNPQGLASDGEGNIYVADDGNNSVDKIAPSGGYFITPGLHQGLSFDSQTGIISGTAYGTSTITYTITAWNSYGSTSAKVVISIKPVANNATLISHKLSTGSIFSRESNAGGVITASTSIDPSVSSLTVTPVATDSLATIKVNGVAVTSGTASQAITINPVGGNVITIAVTSQDGSRQKTYKLDISRNGSNNNYAMINTVKADSGIVRKTVSYSGTVFDQASVTGFNLSVAAKTGTVTFTPITGDPAATLTINGSPAASNSPFTATLGSGPSTLLDMIVTAADGSTRTYPISITRRNTDTLSGSSIQTTGDALTADPALSPNGDGINDVFTIKNIGKYPENKLTIINSGGVKVFEAAGYDNVNKPFNGRSNITGQKQPPGTYFYVLQYKDNGALKTQTGYLVLRY